MRRKFFVLALLACAAVTAYVLWQMRHEAATGRAAGHEARPLAADTPEALPVASAAPEPVAEPVPAPVAEEALPPLPHVDPPGSGTLVGFVRSGRGEAVRDAEVKITPLDGKSAATTTHPDAQGFVRVDGLPPGRYRLDATHPDFAPRSFFFDVAEGGGAGPLDIVLVEGGALRVRVLGAYGVALAEQAVGISHGYGGEILGGRTDARGEFLFKHLPAGQYYVHRPGENGASEEMRTATVEPSKTVEVVFEISCGLVGTLLGPDGRPLVGAILRLTPAEFGSEGYRNVEARTDEEGRFELRGFASGMHRPNVQVLPRREEGQPPVPGYVVSLPVMEFVPGQVRTEVLRIPPSLLSGRITRADTGEALGGDRVQIQAYGVEVTEGKPPVRRGDHNMAWADDAGRFRFPGLPPGHYEIWVFPMMDKNLSQMTRIVDFTAGGTLEDVNFVLPGRKLGRVRLRVLEPDGTPATGLFFGVALEGNTSLSLNPRQVGDGVYEVEVEAGPRLLHVYRKGFRPEEVAVEVPADGVVEREVRLRAESAPPG